MIQPERARGLLASSFWYYPLEAFHACGGSASLFPSRPQSRSRHDDSTPRFRRVVYKYKDDPPLHEVRKELLRQMDMGLIKRKPTSADDTTQDVSTPRFRRVVYKHKDDHKYKEDPPLHEVRRELLRGMEMEPTGGKPTSADDTSHDGSDPTGTGRVAVEEEHLSLDQLCTDLEGIEAGSGESDSKSADVLSDLSSGRSRRTSEKGSFSAYDRMREELLGELEGSESTDDKSTFTEDEEEECFRHAQDEEASPYSRHEPCERRDGGSAVVAGEKPRTDMFSRAPEVVSDRIHVLGADIHGRFITHCIAACKTISPPRYLIHRAELWERWVQDGRCLELHRGKMVERLDRVEGEYVTHKEAAPESAVVRDKEHIDNLIVTVPANSVVRSLEPLMHRLSALSTICLVQDGLGVAEDVVERLFPDTRTRPTFILGHSSHKLGYSDPEHHFSVAQVHGGRLFLTAYMSGMFTGHTKQLRISVHPPIERHTRPSHLLRLLLRIPELNASAHPWEDWLRYKLPGLAFQAVAETVRTVVDTTYMGLASNAYARQLMEHLLAEICEVTGRLPEVKSPRKFRNYYRSGQFYRQVAQALMMRREQFSSMQFATVRGLDSDLDYTLGYFVKRGRELGYTCLSLKTLAWMVKARHRSMYRKRLLDVPLVLEGAPQKEPPYRPQESYLLPPDEGHFAASELVEKALAGGERDLLAAYASAIQEGNRTAPRRRTFRRGPVVDHDGLAPTSAVSTESDQEQPAWVLPRPKTRSADVIHDKPLGAEPNVPNVP